MVSKYHGRRASEVGVADTGVLCVYVGVEVGVCGLCRGCDGVLSGLIYEYGVGLHVDVSG